MVCAWLLVGVVPVLASSVLVAGDSSLPVFDAAVAGVLGHLGARDGDVAVLRASVAGARSASLRHVLGAISAMRPLPGQGCFVFATSHGSPGEGLWLSVGEDYLTPAALDRALDAGCGDVPTAVVISGCYSGSFARPPMARANRVVLTAARADRSSFGCGAGRTYTVYDKCLLDALDAGGIWKVANTMIRSCVRAEERIEGATPSEPQAWFGAEVAGLRVP